MSDIETEPIGGQAEPIGLQVEHGSHRVEQMSLQGEHRSHRVEQMSLQVEHGSHLVEQMSLQVELVGVQDLPGAPTRAEIERLCLAAAATAGVSAGHLAIEIVTPERIAQLNAAHRGKAGPTDVLSFPIDGAGPIGGGGIERELGDIVICPQHTADLREAIVHGVLHLLGMDHETDNGEMLALQAQILADPAGPGERRPPAAPGAADAPAGKGERP